MHDNIKGVINLNNFNIVLCSMSSIVLVGCCFFTYIKFFFYFRICQEYEHADGVGSQHSHHGGRHNYGTRMIRRKCTLVFGVGGFGKVL